MPSFQLTAAQLRDYRLPGWDELPAYDVFNQQMVQIVRQSMDPLFPRVKSLTVNMVQNYLKWNLLPKPNGRKYTREHIAWCMVISMLKSVFNIEQVRDGIIAYQAMMPIHQAYNRFVDSFACAMRTAFGQMSDPNDQDQDPAVHVPSAPVRDDCSADLPLSPSERKYLALTSVTKAVAYQLLTSFAIEQERKHLRSLNRIAEKVPE